MLDFWIGDGSAREQAYLEAYLLARPILSKTALILIDDADHTPPWKHSKIEPAALKDGWREVYTGRQMLLAAKQVHITWTGLKGME